MKKYIYTLFWLFLVACSSESQHTDSHDDHHEEGHEEERKMILTEEQFQLAGIKLDTMSMKNIVEGVHCIGRVEMPPQYESNMHSPMAGRITEVKGLAGQEVKKGETLARIEHADVLKLKEEYLSVKNELAFCELEVKRYKALSMDKSIALKKLQESEKQKEILTAKRNSFAKKLKLLGINAAQLNTENISPLFYIRSPYDGYISSVNIKLGDYVGEHDPLFTVVSPEHMHVELYVFESSIQEIALGQEVQFYTANGGMIGKGDVFLVNKVIDPETRTLQIHAHIDHDFERNFIPGMSINAEILTNAQYVRVLPEFAVIKEGSEQFVFKEISPLQFEKTKVEIGGAYRGYIHVKSDLGGDSNKIVVEGANRLAASMMAIEGHDH